MLCADDGRSAISCYPMSPIRSLTESADLDEICGLAELILPYGFKQPPEKPRLWLLRHFFRPGQVNPLKLRPLHALMKSHGMLFALERSPFHIDASKIPADFIEGFEPRCCARLACEDCRYCEAIAQDAVTIDAAFERAQSADLTKARQQLIDGRLWGV